ADSMPLVVARVGLCLRNHRRRRPRGVLRARGRRDAHPRQFARRLRRPSAARLMSPTDFHSVFFRRALALMLLALAPVAAAAQERRVSVAVLDLGRTETGG